MLRTILLSLACLGLIGIGAAVTFGVIVPRNQQLELGVLFWVTIGLGGLGVVISAALCFVTSRGVAVPAPLVLLLPMASTVFAEWVLSLEGMDPVGEATVAVAPEQRLSFMAHGYSNALGSGAVAYLWAGLAFLSCCFVAAAAKWDREEVSPQPDPLRWVWLGLGVAGALAVAIWASIEGGSPVVILAPPGWPLLLSILALALVPLMLVAVGRRQGDLEKRPARRIGIARIVGAGGLIGGAFCLAQAAPLLPASRMLSLFATASPMDRVDAMMGRSRPLGPFYTAALSVDTLILISAATVALLIFAGGLRWLRSWIPLVMLMALSVYATVWLGDNYGVGSYRRVWTTFSPPCTENCLPGDMIIALPAQWPLPQLAPGDACDPPINVRVHPSVGELAVAVVDTDRCADRLRPMIVVTTKRILVDDLSVQELEDGAIPARAVRDGAAGYFVPALFEELNEAAENQRLIAERNPSVPFEGRALLIIDRNRQSFDFDRIAYTASQAGYHTLDVVARHPGRERPAATRAVPFPSVRVGPDVAQPDACQGTAFVVRSPLRAVEGVCSGNYRVDDCATLEVPGTDACQGGSPRTAERWRLMLVHDRMSIYGPNGGSFTAASAAELARMVREHNRGRAAARVLQIRRHPRLPIGREIEVRAVLVSEAPELFTAAFITPGDRGTDLPAPPEP